MGQEAETPWIPFAMLIPLLEPKCWGLLGLLQASATDQKPWHDGKVQSAAQATRVYFDMLPVYLLLCIPSRVFTENGYSSAVYFLQKMLGTFLSQTKEFRIQLSTSIMWINGPGKVFLWFCICKALSIDYLVYVKLSPASYYPAIKEKFLFKHPAWMTDIITTNSNSSTIKLPQGIFSPNTKGTCELTGSRWGYIVYGAAWQHREQISGVIFFTHFCLTHFYIVWLSPFFVLLILYFRGSCWNNFFLLTSFKSQHIMHSTMHCCHIITMCLYHLFFLSFQLQ